MTYEVQTEVFAGPFDLLLHLILREQVDLYEISLSPIVDAFLAEMAKLDDLDLEVATEFLLIASTLVELKTRRMLPGDNDVDLDDELALWEERDLLLSKLLECKTFKDAAQVLARMAETAGRSHPRTAGIEERFVDLAPDPLTGVSPLRLRDAFVRATTPPPVRRVDLEHVAPVRLSVTEAVEELVDELPRLGRTSFRAITDSMVERQEVVVRFLALLELFKQGLIDIDQAERFGDIEIVWLGTESEDDDRPVYADLAAIDTYEG